MSAAQSDHEQDEGSEQGEDQPGPAEPMPTPLRGNLAFAGAYAERTRNQLRELLLTAQQADGSWMPRHGSEHGAGKVYATSLAVLALTVEYHYLPIYQR